MCRRHIEAMYLLQGLLCALWPKLCHETHQQLGCDAQLLLGFLYRQEFRSQYTEAQGQEAPSNIRSAQTLTLKVYQMLPYSDGP